MAASSRNAREAKRRVQQMEARRGLRRDQDKRRKRDNVLAISVGTGAIALALVLQLTVFSSNPTEEEFAAAQEGLAEPVSVRHARQLPPRMPTTSPSRKPPRARPSPVSSS